MPYKANLDSATHTIDYYTVYTRQRYHLVSLQHHNLIEPVSILTHNYSCYISHRSPAGFVAEFILQVSPSPTSIEVILRSHTLSTKLSTHHINRITITMAPSPSSKSSSKKRSIASVHSREVTSATLLPLRSSSRLREKLERQAQATSVITVDEAETIVEATSSTSVANNDGKKKKTKPLAAKKALLSKKQKKKKFVLEDNEAEEKRDVPTPAHPHKDEAASVESDDHESDSIIKKTAPKTKTTKPRKKVAKKERERWPGKRKLDWIMTDPVYW